MSVEHAFDAHCSLICLCQSTYAGWVQAPLGRSESRDTQTSVVTAHRVRNGRRSADHLNLALSFVLLVHMRKRSSPKVTELFCCASIGTRPLVVKRGAPPGHALGHRRVNLMSQFNGFILARVRAYCECACGCCESLAR